MANTKTLSQLTWKQKIADVLQMIGPAIMPVIAVLPPAALAMGIGSALQQDALVTLLPFLQAGWIHQLAVLLNSVGSLIIGNLGVFFAVGIAVNLTNKSGMAGLSALVSFLVMHQTINCIMGLTADSLASTAYASVLGIVSYQCGVFGGLVIGILMANLYNRFHEIQLPEWLSFFAGERFVLILALLGGMVTGAAMCVVWPLIQGVFDAFTNWLTTSPLRFLVVFCYGFFMRLVQAFGLQHLIYPFFYFQMGEYVTKAGNVVTGDSSIFFAQMADGVDITVGGFMTGSYIASILCVGIAFAMYRTARPERKKKVKGVLFGAALCALLTGITEPVEFSFLLISPVLWVIYSALVGLGYAICDLLQIRLGTALAGNVVDYILYGVIPQAKNWFLLIPVGIAFFVVVYFIFSRYIKARNLHTIGRESEEDIAIEKELEKDPDALPRKVLEYLGGASNIKSITNCITRVRAKVYDRSLVDVNAYKEVGAKACVTPGSDSVQLVYGAAAEPITASIKRIMSGEQPQDEKS